MCDAGVRCSPVELDPTDTGLELIFAELVVFSSIDNLLHVRVSHKVY